MPIFRPKSGSIWKWNRLLHFLFAATITACGGHLWGYSGAVWCGFGSIVIGFLWELSNRFIGRGWHPYADSLDFWAFVLGAFMAGVSWTIL